MSFGYPICLTYTVFWIHDSDTPYRGGRRSSFFRSLPLWKWASQYFPALLIVYEKLREWSKENGQDCSKNREPIHLPRSFNYLPGYHSHGIYAIGAVLGYACESVNLSKIFPGIRPYMTSWNPLLRVPFFRDFVMISGNLVAVAVGGSREVLESRTGPYVLVLNRRRGFFEVALKTGSHLVPSVGFGETNLYDKVDHIENSRLRKMQNWFMDKFAVAPALIYSTRVISYRRPLTIVTSHPSIVSFLTPSPGVPSRPVPSKQLHGVNQEVQNPNDRV
ncbi:hypothetical protein Aperf_G00000093761 [Anoplocephala perfoliata]